MAHDIGIGAHFASSIFDPAAMRSLNHAD